MHPFNVFVRPPAIEPTVLPATHPSPENPPVLSEALEAAPRHQLSGFSLHQVIRSSSERRANVQQQMKVKIFKKFPKGVVSVEAVLRIFLQWHWDTLGAI